MKTITKHRSPRKRVVSISIRTDILDEVDRRSRGRRSAYIEQAVARHLRQARRDSVLRDIEAYYGVRPDADRAEEQSLMDDFGPTDRESWDRIDG